jgi:OsmC subfamily peroxiredoxin
MTAERRAKAIWEGTLLEGHGRLSAESSQVLSDQSVTWASRTEDPGGRTSPEELLAAAHAACYAMALSAALARRGTTADRLEVTATCAFDKVGEGWGVTACPCTSGGGSRVLTGRRSRRRPGPARRAAPSRTRSGVTSRSASPRSWRGSGMLRIWGLSKTAANYRQAPRGEIRCDACRFMFPKLAVGGCRYVRGAISPSYTCDQFAPARPAHGSVGPP